ncbi:class I SAM-dependent methyltransferase [Chryseobacterium gwangjuense]|uniref:class I SAM-dependent methyltransferase n=1 Tax=Chryseobacterium gwangjuense TaxID=1069980 RepID=UPI001E3A2DBB|nr:class I SAM-dependent methyltransferase [Chryseobacterium gwangjuense]MCE3075440.1 class I SAM-dependent methyltransferase [Chryseobacterium gwangjuense]
MKIHLLKKNEIVIDKNNEIAINKSELSKISLAEEYINNQFHIETEILTRKEISKMPLRHEIINFILTFLNRDTEYLEIGVRNTKENFDLITATKKHSVDPGYESEINNADFKLTSDEFFEGLRKGNFLNSEIKFDVIFIDGSHLAEQVERDIRNSLDFLKEDGFIIMHDCNPPTEFHASENYYYRLSPSRDYWNGTTWKAFFKARKRTDIFSCCIDTDWGVGIISKTRNLGKPSQIENAFFEYHVLNDNRKDSLNLVSFEEFKNLF